VVAVMIEVIIGAPLFWLVDPSRGQRLAMEVDKKLNENEALGLTQAVGLNGVVAGVRYGIDNDKYSGRGVQPDWKQLGCPQGTTPVVAALVALGRRSVDDVLGADWVKVAGAGLDYRGQGPPGRTSVNATEVGMGSTKGSVAAWNGRPRPGAKGSARFAAPNTGADSGGVGVLSPLRGLGGGASARGTSYKGLG